MKTANEKSLQCQTVNLSIIEKLLNEYKNTRGAVIPILQKVQAEYGYLPEPVIDLIAERLNISASEMWELPYSMHSFI